MPRLLAVAAIGATLALSGCVSSGRPAPAADGTDWVTAISAEAGGGFDALVAAARAKAPSTSSPCPGTGRTTRR